MPTRSSCECRPPRTGPSSRRSRLSNQRSCRLVSEWIAKVVVGRSAVAVPGLLVVPTHKSLTAAAQNCVGLLGSSTISGF